MKPPPPKPTPKARRTRADILHRAMDLSSAEGLVNLSIGRLARKVSLSKSGLFAHFGSKEGLQLAIVEAAKERFISIIVTPVQAVPRGLPMLAALLESWLRYVENETFCGGCFFFAVSAEFDDRTGVVRNKVVELTKEWITSLKQEGERERPGSSQDQHRYCPVGFRGARAGAGG